MRSFLFVPADSMRKFEKAMASSADALILDLEDAIAPDGKDRARGTMGEMLKAPRKEQKLFARINAMDTGLSLDDLVAAMPGKPDGIVLPKSMHGDDIRLLSAWLDALETVHSIERGTTQIIAIVTETAEALFNLVSYKGASSRLWGLMWGAEDLAASFGATTNRVDGTYAAPFVLARNLCLAGAAAAGVVAIDTVCTDITNIDLVRTEAMDARRDGFGAKAIIHPAHVEPVNLAFSPSDEQIAWAKQVVEALDHGNATGVASLNGKMIDKPHLLQARRLLENLR